MTPDTLLRWYRRLIAKKCDGSKARRPGRPGTAVEIEEPIIRMARDNPTWGYTRIRRAVYNLGHEIDRNTIKHEERPHQGLSGRLIAAAADPRGCGPLARRQRLGGLLNHYYREAA